MTLSNSAHHPLHRGWCAPYPGVSFKQSSTQWIEWRRHRHSIVDYFHSSQFMFSSNPYCHYIRRMHNYRPFLSTKWTQEIVNTYSLNYYTGWEEGNCLFSNTLAWKIGRNFPPTLYEEEEKKKKMQNKSSLDIGPNWSYDSLSQQLTSPARLLLCA